MPTALISAETIEGVAGTRFRTNAQPHTDAERLLQEIQSTLSGGMNGPPLTVAHLNFYARGVADGPDKTYISLWVPREQQSQTTSLLEDAGFSVSDA